MSEAMGKSSDVHDDVHASKIPADDPRLRLDRPRGRTLRKGPAIAVALTLIGAVGVALAMALQPSAGQRRPEQEPARVGPVAVPESLRLGGQVGEGPRAAASVAAKPTPPPGYDPVLDAPPIEEPSPEVLRRLGIAPRPTAMHQGRNAIYEAGEVEKGPQEEQQARSASLFAAIDGEDGQRQKPAAKGLDLDVGASAIQASPSPPLPQAAASASRTSAADAHQHKVQFLEQGGRGAESNYGPGLVEAQSPFEVKAGAVIPTVLLTGINSELPGQIVGQVRENVYDTVSGNYLLIPQGSRVIAKYDSMVVWGQQRVLLCWNRLIRPDGSSVNLECMPAVDARGYAGVADDVDNHWWRLVSGVALSSLLSATSQAATGNVTGFQPTLAQQWSAGAASEANHAGQAITRKNLEVQPTITVRPGFNVNVFVTKDLILPPYKG
jgi:type IV secretory pathway VirB10-like protein